MRPEDMGVLVELARLLKETTEWILRNAAAKTEKERLAFLRTLATIPELSSGAFVMVMLYGIMHATLSAVEENGMQKGPNENFTNYCRAMALFERQIQAEDRPDLDRCRGLLRSAGVGMRWGLPGKDVCDDAVAEMFRIVYKSAGDAETTCNDKALVRTAGSGPSAA